MSWLIFIEHNLGPHMLQKWAAEPAGVGAVGGSLPIRAFSLAPPFGADQVFADGQASTQSGSLGRDVVTVAGIKAGEVHGLVGPEIFSVKVNHDVTHCLVREGLAQPVRDRLHLRVRRFGSAEPVDVLPGERFIGAVDLHDAGEHGQSAWAGKAAKAPVQVQCETPSSFALVSHLITAP